jgi:hypothetical protein
LDFKGFQFLGLGVLRSFMGLFLYAMCVTAPSEDSEHTCEDNGPGVTGGPLKEFSYIGLVFGFLLQMILIWLAFFLIRYSKDKGRTALKGHIEMEPGLKGTKHRGGAGYMWYLLIFDAIIFFLCVGVVVFAIFRQEDYDWQAWPVKHVVFLLQCVYGYFALPFFFFTIPYLQNVLTHTVPTGYTERGICVRMINPQKRKKTQAEKDAKKKAELDELLGADKGESSDSLLERIQAMLMPSPVVDKE